VTSELNTPKGFAGLDDLVSEVVVNEPKPAFEGKAAGTSPLPGTDPSTPAPSKVIPGWAWGVGLIAIIGVIVAINQSRNHGSTLQINELRAWIMLWESGRRAYGHKPLILNRD
jgi:hypothetical protein